MKRKTIWWLAGLSLAALIIIVIVGKNMKDEGTIVAVEAADLHTITETVTASGKIYPETEIKISPEVSGEIRELNVEEGDSVRKGQLLVRINPSIYTSIVEQAQSSVSQSQAQVANSEEMAAQAKAQYDQALANYNRNNKLYKEKVISALEFEQFETTYRAAKATYEAARSNISGGKYGVAGAAANLSQARENLRKTTIFAPADGIVSALNVTLGERVLGTAQMAGTEMLTIADLGRIEVRVDVSETDIAKVKLGDTTRIEADAYRDKKFTGVVTHIGVSSKTALAGSASTDQVTNYTVRILILPESYADLRGDETHKFPFKPGMSASVDIETARERNILCVPVNAVTTRDEQDSTAKAATTAIKKEVKQVVFVLDSATHKVSIREVKTGLQYNEYIQVLSGLKKGEQIVVAPYGAIARTLKEGTKVTVKDKKELFTTE